MNIFVPGRSLPARSTPETALEPEGEQDEEARSHGSDGGGGAGTIVVAENGGNPVGKASEAGLSPVPSAKDFCFVKAILHLPDEDSRPSVSLLLLCVTAVQQF